MKYSLLVRTDASILCLLLFIGCIIMVNLGKFCRGRFFQNDQQESKGGVNSLLGALFGLWGFLLAFTFGNSASKFENARNVTVDESNIIRNTILRIDMFPDSIRNELRADLQIYLDALITYYSSIREFDKFKASIETAEETRQRLWATTVKAANLPNLGAASGNMFFSLTTMSDLGEKRHALFLSGVPEPVIYMLFFLAMTISFIGGFTTPVIKFKEWIVILGFLLLACSIIYITLDLGRPLRGLIQLKTGKERLIEIQQRFFH